MTRHRLYAPGDVVSVRFAGVLRHYGIVSASGTVISNSNHHGRVIEQSIDAFSNGKPIKTHRRPSDTHGFEVSARARRALGASYDLTGSNCIDLVQRSHGRRATPWQVGKATMMALGDMMSAKRKH